MKVILDENSIYVYAPEPSVRNYLVNYMGASYSKPKDRCVLPRTLGVLDEMYAKVPDLRDDPGLLKAGKQLTKELQDEVSRRISIKPLSGPLRPYQSEDAQLLAPMEAAGVFNEPRTGKTPTIIEALKLKGTKRNLIVSPASLLWTWAFQLKQWYPEAKVTVLDRKTKTVETEVLHFQKAKLKEPHFLIVSKNSILSFHLDKLSFDTVVVDEAHFLRNHKSAQSKTIFKLKAKSRYALTGTPTVKHPSDIYGILRFLHPKQFTSFWGLCGRFFISDFNPHGTSEHSRKVGPPRPGRAKELQQLVGLLSVSRKRKEVMPWLPEKDPKTIHSKMGAKQEKYYRDMERIFYTMAEDYDHDLDAQSVMVQLMRLRQLAIDPRINGFRERGCKTETLLQILKERKEDGARPVVVMSMFTSYLRILAEDLAAEGYRIGAITGEMTVKQKQEQADKFQRGELDALLCNIIAAGTGWTLDRGDTVIFMDTAWNPSDNEQAEDRVTPTTPEALHDHNVIHISTIGTVDQKMFSILERKQSLTDILNNGAREAVRELLS